MPTYAFKCPKCGFDVEILMSIREFSDGNRPLCTQPGCDGQQKMETQIFAVPSHFKGTGWTPKGSDSWGAPTDIVMPKKR